MKIAKTKYKENKMKITKRQLQEISKIATKKLLKEEPSDYYRDYKSGSISYEEYQQMVKDYEHRTGDSGSRTTNYRRPRRSIYLGSSSNADQIAAVEASLNAKPNNFLVSILSQLKNGRDLSGKQKSIVKRIVSKNDPSFAALFESGTKIKITKRQLKRIIKEERTKILKEMNGPGAIDPRYMQARAIFEDAQTEVAEMLGFGIEDIQEMAEIRSDLSFAAFLGELLEAGGYQR
tara:strand:- start:11805 stop:12506 length:702 start_codon:yes stop_codon:yes gene_type:complete